MENYEMINRFLSERADEVKEDNADKKATEIVDKLEGLRKEFRSLSHAIDRRDTAEAKDIYKKIEKELDDIEDKIEDLPEFNKDSDKGKAIARRIAKAVFGLSTVLAIAGGVAFSNTGSNASAATTLGGVAGMLGSVTALGLNKSFKSQMCSKLNKYKLAMDLSISAINEIDRENKEDAIRANTKRVEINKNNTNDSTIRFESANVVDTKLNIYEAYEVGFITESEKSDLLDMIDKSAEEDELKKKRNIKRAIKITLILTGIAAATLISLKAKKKYDAKKCDKLMAELKEYEAKVKDLADKTYDSPFSNTDLVNSMRKCINISKEISRLSGDDASTRFNKIMDESDKIMNMIK